MANIHGNEFHLGRNTIIILVVIQLTALLFGLMTLKSFTAVNCGPGQVNITNGNIASTNPVCSLTNQTAGINGTVHSLVNVFSCVGNSSATTQCYIKAPPTSITNSTTPTGCWFSGCPINTIAAIFATIANMVFGVFTGIGYIAILIGQLLYLIVFILTVFFPALFSIGAFGSFGILFGILFDGATIIMLFYVIYLVVNRLPWFGKH